MGVDLYALRKRAVMVLAPRGIRETVYFLQLAVEHALSQDSQQMVDTAVKYAYKEWQDHGEFPKYVVQVGINGLPQSGSPIFKWPFFKRSYCFDHELPAPFGYLGEREIWGYPSELSGNRPASILSRRLGASMKATEVYKDFWHGEMFESGEEFLGSRAGSRNPMTGMENPGKAAMTPCLRGFQRSLA